ncbi:dsRBD fold-containing protein [Mycolicibacterium arenosum]|uniref:DUF1876 domain-containing protein n=1 Tax=Mycolicibacterium arenosum TaxID=2952157 RepID=A0ABT1LXY1_9MYCO|nr:dsRBD fold-containing protein [Mycolicibacterium sp. CAU 1645]MCP9270914.1 DUF1876 domain-containing protein [Mycolicibacterium sp. CAU 1645]
MPTSSPRHGDDPVVTIVFDEYNHHNRAVARVHWNGTTVVGRGLSRLDADDEAERRVGEKLALARALSHVVRQLFTDAAIDIEAIATVRSA